MFLRFLSHCHAGSFPLLFTFDRSALPTLPSYLSSAWVSFLVKTSTVCFLFDSLDITLPSF